MWRRGPVNVSTPIEGAVASSIQTPPLFEEEAPFQNTLKS
jgi:hypothetical protein